MKTRPTIDADRGLKRCSTCELWLAFSEFGKDKDRLKSRCRTCVAKYRTNRCVVAEPIKYKKPHIFHILTREELRECSQCRTWLSLDAYFMHGAYRSNLCKPCERCNARDRARRDVANHVAAAKRWNVANHEKIRQRKPAYQKRYADTHRDEIQKRMREYMRVKSKTPEYRAYQREYNLRTGYAAEKAARRRAQKMGVEISRVDRNAIILRDGRRCYLCGVFLKWREVTLDHVVPLARGGKHSPENLRVACGPCNFSKQDRLITTLPLGL